MTAEAQYAAWIDDAFTALHAADPSAIATLGDERGWRLFVAANRFKREQKILDRLPSLAAVFRELPTWARCYAETMPTAVNDSLTADTDRFLLWLADRAKLDVGQRDQLVLQRARHELEERADREPGAHREFVRLSAAGLGLTAPGAAIVANPLRATVELHGHGGRPVPVVVYPFGDQYRGRALGADAARVLAAAAARPCCSIGALAAATGLAERTAWSIGESLVACGLIAVTCRR